MQSARKLPGALYQASMLGAGEVSGEGVIRSAEFGGSIFQRPGFSPQFLSLVGGTYPVHWKTVDQQED